MRVLIVSYYFPPAAGGGMQRVLAWCRNLPEYGVEPFVLTPDDPKWIDSGGGLEVPEQTTVVRSRNISPRSIRPSDEINRRSSRIARLVRKIQMAPRRLLIPDIHIGWKWTAIRAGVRAARTYGIDVVVSTSPPKTDHVVARAIAKRCGIPWVADFRDSWLDLPHLRLENTSVRWKHKVHVRYATRLMRHADHITTVSEPLAVDLRRRHPTVPVSVITNGIDRHDLATLPEPQPLLSGLNREDRFVLAYTGNFFGRQSPATFLSAMEAVAESLPSLHEKLTVRLIGGLTAADHARIDASAALSKSIERLPFLDYHEVLAEQRAADMLLLYVAPGVGSEGVFTGKVFEYVAAERPILSLLPTGNVCRDLVTRAGTGVIVDPDDIAAIAAAIADAVEQWEQSGRVSVTVPADVLDSIDRRHRARELADIARSL